MEKKQLPIIDAISDGFKRYTDFSGASSRSQYWYFILGTTIVSIIVQWILGEFAANVFTIATIIPTIAVAVRRMHDVGKSGWFILVPIYNFILLVTPTKPATNQF
jgi:uncharacterized membrane protein YhaH (DUF805 family)